MAAFSTLLHFTKNKQARAVATYTFANFFSKGISFLLLFYFTKVLTQADLGMLSLYSNGILFLMPFISLGILQSINTDFFKLDKQTFKHFFTTVSVLPICVAFIAMACLYVCKATLIYKYHLPIFCIILLPIIAVLNFINEQLTILIRNNNLPVHYVYINIGRLCIEIGIAVILISGYTYGWLGRVIGIVLAYLTIAMYALYYFKKNNYLFGKFSLKFIQPELVYGIPIIALQMGVFCLSASSVYFIEHFTTQMATVGIYSVAATFASIINVFCIALLQYFQPKIYSLLSQKNSNSKALTTHFMYYSIAMLTCTCIVIMAVPFVYHYLLPTAYKPGLSYYYFICMGQFFWAITYFLLSFLLYHKKKKQILFISVMAIICSITCNFIGASLYGAYGTAVAASISYGIILLLSILILRKQLTHLLHQNKVALI